MPSAPTQLVLAVDVGNSRIKFGLFDVNDGGPARGELPSCLAVSAVPLDATIPWDQILRWELLAGRNASTKGIVAGANPAGIEKVLAGWPAEIGPPATVIQNPSLLPIDVRVDEPANVGIDRLLNGVAVNIVRPAGTPAIIVDTGTATTVDFLSADGTFDGGAILPGFELAARSLHRYTALLPLIEISELTQDEEHAGKTQGVEPLGRNTRDAIRSGVYWGQVGAVRQLIAALVNKAESEKRKADDCSSTLQHAPVTTPLAVFLTGGAAPLLLPHLTDACHVPHLALQGLTLAGEPG